MNIIFDENEKYGKINVVSFVNVNTKYECNQNYI